MTVVEDFDPDTIIHGPPRIPFPPAAEDDIVARYSRLSADAKSRSAIPPMTVERTNARETTSRSGKSAPVTKIKTRLKMSKKVKYQTKAERSIEKKKQRVRRSEKAERAGGKASRRTSSRIGGGKKR